MEKIINDKKNLIKIIDRLVSNNHEVYFVGGMVRDYLLNREIHDFDLTTSAEPNEIEDLFKDDYKLNLRGLKHGTVSIISEGEMFEITTFRKENGYLDNRHPSSVEFVKNIYEDLLRRDFTINALAINVKDYSKVIDYFGGLRDLDNKIIRTVNNSEIRLTEDALRILRALRFSSILGFKIDRKTKKSIFKHMNLLDNISKERIIDEIKRMFEGIYFKDVFIEFYKVFSFIFDLNDKKIKKRTINNNIDKLEGFNAKFALIMYYSNRPQEVTRILKFSNAVCENLDNVLSLMETKLNNDYDIRMIFRNHSNSTVYDFVNVKGALDSRKRDKYLKLYYDNYNKCNRIKDLNINGYDLKELGIFKRRIKYVLNRLLDLVIGDELENDKEKLKEKSLEIV